MPSSYLNDTAINNYVTGANISQESINQTITKMMTTTTNGIEGLPYQFMETVDRRVDNTNVGRKYAEKIFSRMPLLFLTPCEPLFMSDFKKKDKSTVARALLDGVNSTVSDLNSLLEDSGKYYSVDFNYSEYYDYLNTMLACLSVYLGLYDEYIPTSNGNKKLGQMNWMWELNDSFKTFFSAAENVVFYMDNFSQVNETFTNETTESQIAGMINGLSDQVKEINYLFGNGGSVVANLKEAAKDMTGKISDSLSGLMEGIGGGIVGSLADNGVNSLLNGGKIVFPEVWSNSSYDKSYSIDIKLRSPDHDSLSIFLNVLKPYCKLLALVLPRQNKGDGNNLDPNAYSSPFLVKASSKGLFSIDMGIISSLSVTKGAECCWNDDGLPTQIDISIEIKDLYSTLAMSSMYNSSEGINQLQMLNVWNDEVAVMNVCKNTSYMDFLANMAGLNIAQMEIGRRITMMYYLNRTAVKTYGSSAFSRVDQGVSRLINNMYKLL